MSGGGSGYPGGKHKAVTKEEVEQIVSSKSRRSKTFEYKSVDAWHFVKEHDLGSGGNDEVVLNILGAEGWELVCKEGIWDYRTGATPVFLMKREL